MRPVKPHITHHGGCDCFTARFEAMEQALRELLQIQGDIIPGWNDEFIRARWVREIVAKAGIVENMSPPPLPPKCNRNGSPPPEPPT
jgi:hypothetical protein